MRVTVACAKLVEKVLDLDLDRTQIGAVFSADL